MTRSIALLGSTGSIGRQTLEVARELGLSVAALTANKSVDLIEQQAREFCPRLAVLYDEDAARELRARLSKTVRVKLDASDNSAGWKFAEYEMKGVPVRIEIGPKDIENNQCVVVTRHNREKTVVSLENMLEVFSGTVMDKLKEVHDGIYDKALENRKNKTYSCKSIEEITKALNENGDGFIKAMWCGDEACEEKIKEETGVGSRCIPFEQEKISDKCVCCGRPADKMVYWGKAY